MLLLLLLLLLLMMMMIAMPHNYISNVYLPLRRPKIKQKYPCVTELKLLKYLAARPVYY